MVIGYLVELKVFGDYTLQLDFELSSLIRIVLSCYRCSDWSL